MGIEYRQRMRDRFRDERESNMPPSALAQNCLFCTIGVIYLIIGMRRVDMHEASTTEPRQRMERIAASLADRG